MLQSLVVNCMLHKFLKTIWMYCTSYMYTYTRNMFYLCTCIDHKQCTCSFMYIQPLYMQVNYQSLLTAWLPPHVIKINSHLCSFEFHIVLFYICVYCVKLISCTKPIVHKCENKQTNKQQQTKSCRFLNGIDEICSLVLCTRIQHLVQINLQFSQN